MGWPYFHGLLHMPFDWNVTSLEGLLFFLRHDFRFFFHYTGMRVVKAVNQQNITFDNYHSSLHAYIHHHPRTDSGKLANRAERFRALCRHTRDVRGARPLLFVRYAHCSEEFARIDELYSLLRLWAGSQIRLCVVCMLQTDPGKELIYRYRKFPRVLFRLVSFVNVMDFQPFREAIRLSVFDEAGLLNCPTIDLSDLRLQRFRDPYTTMSELCGEGDWLDDLHGQDPSFYPDCPAAQVAWQGCASNEQLVRAVQSGDLNRVRRSLEPLGKGLSLIADPNCWAADGCGPLHFLGELKVSTAQRVVRIAAALLLAHADPRCRNRSGVSALEHARRRGSPAELRALLRAAAVTDGEDDAGDSRGVESSAVLHRALEMLEAPDRARLSLVLGVKTLRVVGQAESLWRHPPPDGEAFIAALEEVMLGLERLPGPQRKREMKRLLLEWHPDKNPDRRDLATTVFQYLQAQKDRVIKR